MRRLNLVWYFLAGYFALNALPHLVKGITGQTHMTPFKRVSSPVLNVIWAFVNAFLASYLLGLGSGLGGLVWPWNAHLTGANVWTFMLGGLAVSLQLATFWSNPNARLPWHKD